MSVRSLLKLQQRPHRITSANANERSVCIHVPPLSNVDARRLSMPNPCAYASVAVGSLSIITCSDYVVGARHPLSADPVRGNAQQRTVIQLRHRCVRHNGLGACMWNGAPRISAGERQIAHANKHSASVTVFRRQPGQSFVAIVLYIFSGQSNFRPLLCFLNADCAFERSVFRFRNHFCWPTTIGT